MKIGDRIYVRGYVDEIRKDTVIVRNDGGYFGTVLSEVTGELPSAQQEIIHCKDCKYGEQDEIGRWYCRGLGCQIGDDDGSGFCSDAERREYYIECEHYDAREHQVEVSGATDEEAEDAWNRRSGDERLN